MKNTKFLIAAVSAFAVLASAYSIGSPKSSIYSDDDLVWMDDFDGKKLNSKNWNCKTLKLFSSQKLSLN